MTPNVTEFWLMIAPIPVLVGVGAWLSAYLTTRARYTALRHMAAAERDTAKAQLEKRLGDIFRGTSRPGDDTGEHHKG